MNLKQTIDCIKKNNDFVVTAHTSLEGDALGSELAFYRILKALGKRAVVINDEAMPYGYEFMPDMGVIKRYEKGSAARLKVGCFCILDCSDLGRFGRVASLSRGVTILNIDHHISNTCFGDVNLIDPKASCCAELVYKLYKQMRIPLDKDTATMLYAGVITDTGSFHYRSTSAFTHKMAADLVSHGVDPTAVYKNIYESIPFADAKVLATLLSSINRDPSGRIAWFEIRRQDLPKRKIAFDMSERLLSFARSLKGIQVAALFKENPRIKGLVRVNLRSQGKADVNMIAAHFGGGGHRTASGCNVKGGMDAVVRKVMRKIRSSI